MDTMFTRVESWIKCQREKLPTTWCPPPLPRLPSPPQWDWAPWKRNKSKKEEERRVKEELERRRLQLQDFCRAVKAETVADLQDVLCSMVLSECVYKRPTAEMIRMINKFKADFGGQVLLERVQPSLDHEHLVFEKKKQDRVIDCLWNRYLLAEAGDTLYASFIGTKQYKDIMTDANILQGILFHDDDTEDVDASEVSTIDGVDTKNKFGEKLGSPMQSKLTSRLKKSKPAAHRGFLARAKGIPALELYKLAQKKNRKLVLCGHSLGGAVASLATLAILRVIASPPSKENDNIPVKCITFSQPPVGNAALRDYVHRKGWHHFFKTYCIPEDLIPRILSPAYFHHYSEQSRASVEVKLTGLSSKGQRHQNSAPMKSKHNDQEQLVLGLGPIQTSFWRLSRLVPIESVQKQLDRFKGRKQTSEDSLLNAGAGLISTIEQMDSEPQSLEIQENLEGISLAPLQIKCNESKTEANGKQSDDQKSSRSAESKRLQGVPYLPSYVPFGELYLLGDLSVDFLSDTEYSKLTSVRSVISELRERFQSHSMRSYRARFQKIHDMFMYNNASPFLGVEQSLQFPHLQQLLGLSATDAVELGKIVESPAILTATSIIPLNWICLGARKNIEPFKVDVMGYGLHLCTLIQAQINGTWCSTSVESLPSVPPYSSVHDSHPELQKMRILVGPPLRRPPTHAFIAESSLHVFPSTTEGKNSGKVYDERFMNDQQSICNEDLNSFVIFCTSDFTTVSKEVYVRIRRVRLIGLEGSGKTSLLTAILGGHDKRSTGVNLEIMHPQVDGQNSVVGGLCYTDSGGVNLQELQVEANRFREELQSGVFDDRKKTDLIVLVHNLSHKVPHYRQTNTPQAQPALSLLLNEAKVLGIPWVLAITNKYSVSAHQQTSLVKCVMDEYQAPPSITRVINSCPYVIPTPENPIDGPVLSGRMAVQSRSFVPVGFIRMPFQRKAAVMPVDGVNSLCKLVHSVLRSHEETTLQELAKESLSQEMNRKNDNDVDREIDPRKGGTAAGAGLGAPIGVGVGVVFALVVGAASALRKP